MKMTTPKTRSAIAHQVILLTALLALVNYEATTHSAEARPTTPSNFEFNRQESSALLSETRNLNYESQSSHASQDSFDYARGLEQTQSEPNTAQYQQQFSKPLNAHLHVHKLNPSTSNNNITCNDGSPVGYYMRLNNHSKNWVIYLQGGGFCGNEESCQQRWQRSPHLMSSNFWPKTKLVNGILSSEPAENPHLWNANHIYVPYCSSDSWSGQKLRSSEEEGGQQQSTFTFMGAKILERVFDSLYEDLRKESSLYEARYILLAGDSAGATGVILNLDRMREFVKEKAALNQQNCTNPASQSGYNLAGSGAQPSDCQPPKHAPVLRGLADSGWFLDNQPYDFDESTSGSSSVYLDQQNNSTDCDKLRCTPLQSIEQAMRFWNGQVPQACASTYLTEPWRCYFGYRTYQTLTTPLFVVQWLYDEAQLMFDHITRPGTSGQWNYVNKVVNEMKRSLENVTALFAPSCFSHSLIIRQTWNQININGVRLPQVLNSWEEQSLIDSTATAITDQLNVPSLMLNSNQPQQSSNFVFTEGSIDQSGWKQASPSSSQQVNEPAPLSLATHSNVNQQERPNQDLRHFTHSKVSTNTTTSRPRGRKRKRNNQQQRTKQTTIRPKQNNQQTDEQQASFNTASDLPKTQSSSNSREYNDLAVADVLFRINREASSPERSIHQSQTIGRLSRSTIVEDSSLMLTNNMPDDNGPPYLGHRLTKTSMKWNQKASGGGVSAPTLGADSQLVSSFAKSNYQTINPDRFRFIDTCGWPQCNRDCPVLDTDFSFGSSVQF